MSEKLILLFSSDVFRIDERLQAELYFEYYRLVYDMIFYITKDHAATEDILQEAFLRALKKPPKYLDSEKIDGWIKKLTRNVALNYIRKNKNRRETLNRNHDDFEVAASSEMQTSPVEQQVVDDISLESLMNFIGQLKEEYRYVLELKYVHEMSYKEISTLLGVSEGAIRQRLLRARESAKKLLLNKGGILDDKGRF